MNNKTKKILKKGAKVSQTLLTYNYIDGKKARDYYVRHYDKSNVDNKTILYESRDGQSMTDSPLAIYLYLKEHNDYSTYRHVWVVKDASPKNIARLLANVPEPLREDIIWVERNTISYAKWLLKAKYLVTNSTFQSYVNKKTNQIYINTWHGTPLKYMGYDIPGSKTSLKNVQRNFLMADFILSPNEHTSHVFLDRYKLSGLFEGQILEGGYPRIDFTINQDATGVIDYLIKNGIQINEGQPIVLYTPTWKGTSINNPSQSWGQIKAELEILREKNPDKNILIKVHPYAYSTVKLDVDLVQYLVPDELDANKVLSLVDVLITDYSSIFFDYLVTDKPIIFYTWDAELYSSYRGMYFEDSELPGPVVSDINVVAEMLCDPQAVMNHSREQYTAMKSKIVPYDDGHVTERIIAQIFDNEISSQIKVYQPTTLKKEKVLIYPGGMQNNGITSSAINLSNQINYDKYDVTFLLWDTESPEIVANIERLNKKARLVYRFGPKAFTLQDLSKDQYVTLNGITSPNDPKMPKKAYKREANRLFNNTHYDVLIDFSGYSFNGLKLFTVMDSKKVIVYQHNDLKLDSQKIINGQKVHARNLQAIFTLYQLVDRVVSVSDVLAKINGSKLKGFVREDQMGAIPNLLTTNKIVADKSVELKHEVNDLQAEGIFKTNLVTEFKSIVDIENNKGVDLPVTASETVKIVGEAFVNDHHYYKIALDFIPRGWVSANFITVDADNTLQFEEPMDRGAWIYRGRRRLFKSPYLNKNKDVISSVKWIGHTFVSVVAKAQTTDGLYYQFVLPDRNEKVWLRAEGMLLMQNGRVRMHQRLWNKLINRHSELTHTSTLPQLLQLQRQATITSIPKGLNKRNEVSRTLNQVGTLFVSDEVSVTNEGRFLRIELDGKTWWISQQDVLVLDIHLPISTSYSVPLADYLLSDSAIMGAFLHPEVVLPDLGDITLSDLEMTLVTDENTHGSDYYDVYSKIKEEHSRYTLDDVVLFDTHKTGSNYQIESETFVKYIDTLTDDLEKEYVLQGYVQVLAKTKLGTAQVAWVYALIENGQRMWVREDTLVNERVSTSSENDANYVMEDNKVNKDVDLFDDVHEIVPVNELAKPWITRHIQANVDGETVNTLIRQNGQKFISDDTGKRWRLSDELIINESPLIEENGRAWAGINSFTFVAIGRLSPEKNQTMLLDAFARVYREHPEAELILLGDGVELEKLMAKARHLQIEDAVLFAGQVSNPMDYLRAADVFVHPSLYEGQPMVLLEALMQNRVIIATNIEANVGVLGNQKYGLITSDISDESFANLMLAVIENQYQLSHFDVEEYQKQALMRFENTISGKKGE